MALRAGQLAPTYLAGAYWRPSAKLRVAEVSAELAREPIGHRNGLSVSNEQNMVSRCR